jgi:hypothetical protein
MEGDIFSEDNLKELVKKKISFVLTTKRNSFLYGKIKKTMNEHFFYKEKLIKCSKNRWSLFFLYLYEDNELKKEEKEAIYKEYDENIVDYGEFRERLDKAGRILIISNLNKDCKKIFEIYKSRVLLKSILISQRTC